MRDIPYELIRQLPLEIQVEIEENLCRKDFNQAERDKIRKIIEQALASGEPITRFVRGNPNEVTRDPRSPIDTLVGNITRESSETARKRRAVFEAAEQDPERYGDLREEVVRSGKVDGAFRRLQKTLKGEDPRHESEYVRFKVVLTKEQNEVVQRVLEATGLSMADALVAVCNFYEEFGNEVL